jgi:hypothetical protein
MQQRPDRFRLVDHIADGLTWLASMGRIDVEWRFERAFGLHVDAVWRASHP